MCGPSRRSSSACRCGSWTVATRSRTSSSIVSAECGGPSTRSAKANEPGAASLSALQLDLRAEARVQLVAPADVDGPAGLAQLAQLGHGVAHDRRDPPAAVAERELEQRRAVAPRARLAGAHEQDLVQILSVGEVAYEHGSNRRAARGRHYCAGSERSHRPRHRRDRRPRRRGHPRLPRRRLARGRALGRRARARARRGARAPRARPGRPLRPRRGGAGRRRRPGPRCARWSTSSAASPSTSASTRPRSRPSRSSCA